MDREVWLTSFVSSFSLCTSGLSVGLMEYSNRYRGRKRSSGPVSREIVWNEWNYGRGDGGEDRVYRSMNYVSLNAPASFVASLICLL